MSTDAIYSQVKTEAIQHVDSQITNLYFCCNDFWFKSFD